MIKADDLSSSDDDAVGESAPKSRGKDEIWKVDDVFETSSSDADDDDDRSRSGNRRLRSRSVLGKGRFRRFFERLRCLVHRTMGHPIVEKSNLDEK